MSIRLKISALALVAVLLAAGSAMAGMNSGSNMPGAMNTGMGGGAHRTAWVPVYALTADGGGLGEVLGQISFLETGAGLIVVPRLHGLPPGLHGFHIHQNPTVGPAEKNGVVVPGLAAGGHFDPAMSGRHGGPYDPQGHLGDLPTLFVAADGTTPYAVLAPKIKSLGDIAGRSLIIHVHGDNYSDDPKPLGGGGARFAGAVLRF